MTLWTIGRTALDGPGFGLEPGPILLSRSGDRVTMSGTYFPASLSEGIAFAQQMSGYGSEPVVPLIGPAQFGVTGFYRPAGFAVTAVPNLTNAQGIWEWTANLERMPNGYGSSQIEHDWLYTDLGVLFGATAELDPPAAVSAPVDFLATSRAAVIVPAWDQARVSATAGHIVQKRNTAGLTPTLVSVAVADFYTACPLIEVQHGDTTWHPVVGRQLGATDSVRISNGIVRWTIESETIGVEAWNGSAWLSANDIYFAEFTTGTTPVPLTSFTVERNDHVQVIVKATYRATSAASALPILFGLRAGAPTVDISVPGLDNAFATIHLRLLGFGATTGGVDDPDNNGWETAATNGNQLTYATSTGSAFPYLGDLNSIGCARTDTHSNVDSYTVDPFTVADCLGASRYRVTPTVRFVN